MDDGLVLNIADDAPALSKKGNANKGGRWTDRVKANRATKRKNTGKNTVKTTGQLNIPGDDAELEDSPRPSKKLRVDVGNKSHSSQHRSNAVSGSRQETSSNRPQQFISSLFTSNPEVEAVKASAPRIGIKPSNAPLTDKSTFTGLGLDPLIVSHLASKMNITAPTSIQREALPALLSTSGEDSSERDVFIQSQTGSGKTLTYLLPILHDLLPLSSLSYIDRSIGTLAIIIAPTRELAKQISDVLEQLICLRLRPQGESIDDSISAARLTRWLVSGLLIGGENRTHEKSRLRKGLPFLVSTPGRLLDHLQNTSSFNVGKCRWLILDEADRLMELGFEDTIKGILQGLDGRHKLAVQAVQEDKSMEVGGWDWTRRRRTVLCSATIREDVQVLAGTALIRPIVVKSLSNENASDGTLGLTAHEQTSLSAVGEKFTPPSQLSQKYVIVPLKLRLVTLIALLRSLLSQSRLKSGTKIIVFLSCTDSVDYHWRLLGSSSIDDDEESSASSEDSDTDQEGEEESKPQKVKKDKIFLQSPLLPDTDIYRLHGSLPLPTRLASLKGFASQSKAKSSTPSSTSSILLCTSVASRGLDLPLVRAVVQYDLPTEGGATEYVHRVGRTARAGKGGEAWSIVLPSEREWVPWIEERIRSDIKTPDNGIDGTSNKSSSLVQASSDSVLRGGFGGKGVEFEERATQVQLSFERWVLKHPENGNLAKKAFQSHMRAYATHPSDEKHLFHIKNLHTGHLAKSFALREAPGNITQKSASTKQGKKFESKKSKASQAPTTGANKGKSLAGGNKRYDPLADHDNSAEQRMQDVVRAQGRLIKKGGVMMSSGASEFHVSGGSALEKLVANR